MNRTKGFTAGAIVAAGLLSRPLATFTPRSSPDLAMAKSILPANSVGDSGEGPWLASCKYWEPMRGLPAPESSTNESADNLSFSMQSIDGNINWTTQAQAKQETAKCPSAEARTTTQKAMARWGIPAVLLNATPGAADTTSTNPPPPGSTNPEKPGQAGHLGASEAPIHAIIAIVSDPVHTHLALDFDREIDALTHAAGDNRYVPSYYWLPWKIPATGLHRKESEDQDEAKEEPSVNRQPGLILFKRVPDLDADTELHSAIPSTIYLFLVAETPTLGVNGAQLQNALQYEKDLENEFQAKLLFSFKSQTVSIIGPNNSGSAESLWRSIQADRDNSKSVLHGRSVDIAGSTQTELAANILTYHTPSSPLANTPPPPYVSYHSFGDNAAFQSDTLLAALACSGYRLDRVAILNEDSTVFGDQSTPTPKDSGQVKQALNCPLPQAHSNLKPFVIRFPREISLLRNAHDRSSESGGTSEKDKPAPTPFLHLNLRDPGASDSIPQFSPEHTPLSQEAQLMSISRYLIRRRTQFIFINATNVLDRIYLAQFLHRAVPEARLVTVGGDWLFDRETENQPYIGTLTVSAYSLLNPTPSNNDSRVFRAFTDSPAEAYYNAASYTFWDPQKSGAIALANYRSLFLQDQTLHTPLWATVVGTDGYYPLGLLSNCASDSSGILPWIDASSKMSQSFLPCTGQSAASEPRQGLGIRLGWLVDFDDQHYSKRPYRAPALSWWVLCILITLLSCTHACAIYFPRYWSPWTRDLAIAEGDKRHRRAMYIFIGTVMLFCMAFVTAYPAIPSFRVIHPNWPTLTCCLCTVLAALASLIVTVCKIHTYLGIQNVTKEKQCAAKGVELPRLWLVKNAALLFNTVSALALLVIPAIWIYTCSAETINQQHSFVGPFFSYRCLYPGSGVSPLLPVLLILFSWYVWAICQCLRLRFSTLNRPVLPGELTGQFSWRLYVSDNQITSCQGPADSCLQSNITSLLITHQVLARLWPNRKWSPFLLLASLYSAIFLVLIFGLKFSGVDRFLWQTGGWPTPFEFLVCLLAFPLMMIGLSGWLRIILIWSSLRRGVLELLEQLPLRYAFTRLKGVGWMNMMRQGGLVEQWQDMARSTESLRQMIHDTELQTNFQPRPGFAFSDLLATFVSLNEIIRQVLLIYSGQIPSIGAGPALAPVSAPASASEALPDTTAQAVRMILPAYEGRRVDINDPQCALYLMHNIEECYAKACEILLSGVLIPYWEEKRIGVVEGNELNELPIRASAVAPEETESKHPRTPLQLHTSTVAEEPAYIRVAEEFLAIRYVSLIRAVLVNLRRLLIFVSAVFVLTIIAWNSYPFQPRQWIDEAFTALLILIGGGVLWVFAQMHRNPILSRITDTNANELGFDFYLRIITFGSVPVLTWLAYQFPEVGGSLFRILEPGLDLFK